MMNDYVAAILDIRIDVPVPPEFGRIGPLGQGASMRKGADAVARLVKAEQKRNERELDQRLRLGDPVYRTESTQRELVAAQSLLVLGARGAGSEVNVCSAIEALLREMDVGAIEREHRLGRGAADFYLPDKWAVIEAKAPGNVSDPDAPQGGGRGGETFRGQIDRYVQAAIEANLSTLPLDGKVPERGWVGILTDACHWHVYRYKNARGEVGDLVASSMFYGPAGNIDDEACQALLGFVKGALDAGKLGKEWLQVHAREMPSMAGRDLTELHKSPQGAAGMREFWTPYGLWPGMTRAAGSGVHSGAEQVSLFIDDAAARASGRS